MRDFQRKVFNLQKAAEEGRLTSNIPHFISPEERRVLTRAYRKQLHQRIEAFYGNNLTAKRNALQKLNTSDIDHIIDLQLSGGNTFRNLKTLDSFTNQDLGRQVAQQLSKGEKKGISKIEVKKE
jgi:hypothetical protein